MGEKQIIAFALKFIEEIPITTWEKFKNLDNTQSVVLEGASNEEVIAYILNNNLIDPVVLAKFMVQMQVTQITAMYEGFYNIKKDHKNEWKSMLESARDKFEYGLNNPKIKEYELGFARRQVMDCIRVFKNDIIEHIEQIRCIDNQSPTEFFLTSCFSLRKCKKETAYAIETVKRLIDAYKLLFIIVSNTQEDSSSLEKNFDEIKNEILAEDNCLLMGDYCKDRKDKDFWYGLSDLWDEQKNFLSESTKVFRNEKEEENERSFWDEEDDNIDLSNIF